MVQFGNDTPDWQGYNLGGAIISRVSTFYRLNSGQTQGLLGAVAGRTYTIYTVTFDFFDSTGATIVWFDTVTGFAFYQYVAHGLRSFTVNYGGQDLTQGAGLYFWNNSVTNMTQYDNCTVIYSQRP